MGKRYVIVNSKKFFIFVTTLLLISIFVIYLIFATNKVYSHNNLEDDYVEYYVKKGDNLWNITLDHTPNNYDIREVIYEVKKVNNLKTSSIYEGDIIKIPIYQ